jgi:hypothetical protein
VIYACVRRKGHKEGTKLKKLSFAFPPKYATLWVAAFEKAIYGGNLFEMLILLDSTGEGEKKVDNRKCIFLIDKTDQKEAIKDIDKYIRPVFVAADRVIEVIGKRN